jgi:hypothetical protein
MDDECMEELVVALEPNRTLTSLGFGWDKVGHKGMQALSGLLRRPSCGIKSVSLGLDFLHAMMGGSRPEPLSADEMGEIGRWVGEGGLRELMLYHECNDEGVDVLMGALAASSTLETLTEQVEAGGRTAKFAAGMGRVVGESKSLTELAAQGGPLHGGGELAKALSQSRSLTSLDLMGTFDAFTPEAVRAMGDALAGGNSRLSKINVAWIIEFGDRASHLSLAASIEANHTLVEFVFPDNFDPDARRTINRVLAQNRKALSQGARRKLSGIQHLPSIMGRGGGDDMDRALQTRKATAVRPGGAGSRKASMRTQFWQEMGTSSPGR